MITPGRRLQRGYAMIMFVLVMVLLSGFTVVTVLATDSDRKQSRQGIDDVAGRASSQAALDELYSHVFADPEFLDPLFQDPAGTVVHPGVGKDSAGRPKWARLVNGQMVPCSQGTSLSDVAASLTRDCVHVGLLGQELNPVTSTPEAVVVEVTTRTECDGAESECTYTRMTQRLRKRHFFDYLYYTQYNTLDPTLYGETADLTTGEAQTLCADRYAVRRNPENGRTARDPRCLDIAYQGEQGAAKGGPRTDVVRGPLFSNDDYILTCGNPLFEGTVQVAGQGNPTVPGQIWRSAFETREDKCSNTPPSFNGNPAAVVAAPELTLPCLLNTRRCAASEDFRAAAGERYRLVQAVPTVPVRIVMRLQSGKTVMDISGAGLKSATGVPLPQEGTPKAAAIVHVTGDVELTSPEAGTTGVLKGVLSVFATKQLRIAGDVAYASPSTPGQPFPAPECTSTAGNATDLLGLTAGEAVIVTQIEGEFEDNQPRCLDAVILSLRSTVYVPEWDVEQDNYTTNAGKGKGDGNAISRAPRLRLFGALATKYQGVFGGYGADDGKLVSGYRKDFYFDDRLRTGKIQAPYIVSPISARWERLDVAELAPCAKTGVDPSFDQTICSRTPGAS